MVPRNASPSSSFLLHLLADIPLKDKLSLLSYWFVFSLFIYTSSDSWVHLMGCSLILADVQIWIRPLAGFPASWLLCSLTCLHQSLIFLLYGASYPRVILYCPCPGPESVTFPRPLFPLSGAWFVDTKIRSLRVPIATAFTCVHASITTSTSVCVCF